MIFRGCGWVMIRFRTRRGLLRSRTFLSFVGRCGLILLLCDLPGFVWFWRWVIVLLDRWVVRVVWLWGDSCVFRVVIGEWCCFRWGRSWVGEFDLWRATNTRWCWSWVVSWWVFLFYGRKLTIFWLCCWFVSFQFYCFLFFLECWLILWVCVRWWLFVFFIGSVVAIAFSGIVIGWVERRGVFICFLGGVVGT